MKNVTEQHVEHALDFLRDNAEAYANAWADVKFLDHMRKAIHAQEAAESKADTIGEQNRDGYRAQGYKDILEKYREAVFLANMLQAQMKAAELKIEVWRTLEASSRRGHV